MQAGRASRTAEYMALFRALEDVRPADQRLFADPYARDFLSAPLRAAVGLARVPLVADLMSRFIDRRWPGVRTSAVARTRFIDDRLSRAVAGGVRQVVILGAGFDARAYRLPALRECVVFEVDHPATQARKRALLGASARGASVCFVPTDFGEEKVATTIAAAGFEGAERSFVLWEGVTNYLTEAAVDETLRWCAKAAPGSEILFTYVHRAVLDDPGSFFGTERLFRTLAAEGERWTFGLDPDHLSGYLRERGLHLLEDVGAADYRALTYGPSASAMRGYEFYRIARAHVPAFSEEVTMRNGGHPLASRHFPARIEALPPFDGPFDAFRLEARDCDVLFATYPAGTVIAPHAHDTENCGVITRGELILVTEGAETRFGPGAWYRLAPGQVHAARFEVETSEIELWFRGH